MFRLWAKEFKDNRMLRDTVIEVDNDDTRTHKIFHAIDEVCHEFDLSNPIWLDSNIDEFKRHAKTRFHQDNFVDSIEFDYLEIHIIEDIKDFGTGDFFTCPLFTCSCLLYSLRIAASGLSLIARSAGKYPATIPTSIANPREISTSHTGI